MLGWLRALPDELIRHRPMLSVWYAHVLLASGEIEGVEGRLRDAERWLDTAADRSEMVVVDEDGFRRLHGTIAVARAGQALALGAVADTVTYARQALEFAPEDDHLGRGGAAGFLGLVSWASGDLDAGYAAYAECMARMQQAGHVSDALGCAIALADIRSAQGRLHDAMRIYEQAMRLATAQGDLVPRGTADMHVGMSALHRERNDLQAATQHLQRSQELGERAGLSQNPYRWRVAMTGIRRTLGDLDGALALLQEAERRYVSDFFPRARPIAALVARLWVAQGKLGDALGWAHEQGLSAQDDLSYLREFEHITLARVLLAQYQSAHADERPLQEVQRLLQRLLKAAEDGGRIGSVLDILVTQALAHQARGDLIAALVPLRQALTLAEPEGYVRLFVDEGLPMAALLEKAAQHGIVQDYARQLLTAAGLAESKTPARQEAQSLIEPLSDRELDVLRLLASDLDGPEIARELVVSLNTLRTHTKNIYSKLGVNNRRAAVRRAEELKLLSQARRH